MSNTPEHDAVSVPRTLLLDVLDEAMSNANYVYGDTVTTEEGRETWRLVVEKIERLKEFALTS